ncbi:MAG: thioredoxin [Proteobacteria bacterium]|nr:thioredoxin [Pseudomonadota bacterium]MCP4918079.1 thioredoxin [Pseudomonadota bacterium]
MSDLIKNVGDADFQSEVLDNDTPVLVDFWATWCAPCRALAPKIEKLAAEYGGKLKVVKVDIDKNRKTAMSYNVRSIPTVLVFKGGDVVGHKVGNVPEADLASLVSGAM